VKDPVKVAGRRGGALIPALFYAAVVFALSSQSNPLPFMPRAIMLHDKVLHTILYAGLSVTVAFGLGHGFGVEPRTAAMLAVAIGSLYGLTDELHQSFVPGRSAEVADWGADTIGSAVGAIGFGLALRWWRARATIRA
jgi:VanZ family protein